ncbi:C6 transcription factor, partial [Aspergillus arachidicola]
MPNRLAVTERNQPAKHVPWQGELADAKARVRHLEEALKAERENRLNSDQYTPPKALSSGSSPLEIPHQFLSSWSATTYLLESYSFDAALSNFRWHLGFCGPRAAPFALTPSFSSTVYERTGFVLNIEDFLNQLAQSFKLQYPTHSTRTIVPKWPPQSLIQRSIEYFSKNRLYSIFPAVDLENAPVHLDPKALGNPDSTTSPANYACLVALTALVTRIRGDDMAFADADPDAYVQAVLTLLPELMIDNANLRSLEALILLALYIAPLGQPRPAGILLAMATRMLYNMGANRNRAPPDETLEQSQHRQHVRALFWLCYAIDKEMSLRECKTPLINDADCDLYLPAAYVSTSSDRSFFPEPLSTKELLFPSDLRLALIKSKIQHLLYSDHGIAQPEARRIQYIRELDQELSDIKSNFPVTCQPEDVLDRSVPDSLLHDLSLRGVNIHLEYYYCLAKIHGASNNGGIPSPQSWSSLPSSMEICHQSARSTLLYLGRVRHLIMPETFWIYAQFLFTAVISLFWQLITTVPPAPTSEEDLQIIEETA